MPKCPKCNEEIEYLECVEIGVQITPMNKNGEYNHDKKEFDGDGCNITWDCPHCLRELFSQQQDAVAWMNELK